MIYRYLYFSPRPWLDEQIVAGVEWFDNNGDVQGRAAVDMSKWSSALDEAERVCAEACANGAKGPHLRFSKTMYCSDKNWPWFLKRIVENRK